MIPHPPPCDRHCRAILIIQESNCSDDIGTDITWFRRARRVREEFIGSTLRSTRTVHTDIISNGSVIQAIVSKASIPLLGNAIHLDPISTIVYERICYVVDGLFAVHRGCNAHKKVYALVRQCNVKSNHLLRIDSAFGQQVLHLNNSVRRVFLLHACSRDASLTCVDPESGYVDCEASVENQLFYCFGRKDAYPPRTG